MAEVVNAVNLKASEYKFTSLRTKATIDHTKYISFVTFHFFELGVKPEDRFDVFSGYGNNMVLIHEDLNYSDLLKISKGFSDACNLV